MSKDCIKGVPRGGQGVESRHWVKAGANSGGGVFDPGGFDSQDDRP